MRFRLLLGLFVLAFFTAACAPPPDLRDPNLFADTSLLTGEPCSAPCWRNITPGQTSWRDAQTILEDATDVENIQRQTDEETGGVAAAWQSVGNAAQCCQLIAEDGETVNVVFIRTRPDMTVGEVIEKYGEPAYAVGTPYTDTQAIINLVFPSVPMILFAYTDGPTTGELSESSEVIAFLYTTPEDIDLFLRSNALHEWEGYAPYTTYSPDEGSSFELTPEPEGTQEVEVTPGVTEEATPEETPTETGS